MRFLSSSTSSNFSILFPQPRTNKKCILGAIIFILPSSLETEAKTISERPRGMTFRNLSLQHRTTKISKVQII